MSKLYQTFNIIFSVIALNFHFLLLLNHSSKAVFSKRIFAAGVYLLLEICKNPSQTKILLVFYIFPQKLVWKVLCLGRVHPCRSYSQASSQMTCQTLFVFRSNEKSFRKNIARVGARIQVRHNERVNRALFRNTGN